jgi:hypothetical protein
MEPERRSTEAVADGRLIVLRSCGGVIATCRPRTVRQSRSMEADTGWLRPLIGIGTEKVQQVEGVTAVVADVEAARVTVQGQGFSDEAVRAAVDEAGYEVVAA